MNPRSPASALFAVLAVALLIAAMVWRIPMMLWDHLDLVPIYQAWSEGDLARSAFWSIHGGHLHTAAYAVLLATTWLSGGHTWLDGVASWLLLLGYAGVVVAMAKASFPSNARAHRAVVLAAVFLALYPGHLANLQWGWQVAVFLCLLGAALTIFFLTRTRLSWPQTTAALAAFALAFVSFATAIALIPTALILIALRSDDSWRHRMSCAAPWLALGIGVAASYPTQHASVSLVDVGAYALNFLGAGIARFASEAAPWLAALGIGSAIWAGFVARDSRERLPWIGFAAFAAIAAVLAGLGRTGAYGTEQAFVTRYVSFASMFWLGWAGLIGCAWPRLARGRGVLRAGVALVAVLGVFNALHMVKKAAEVATRTRAIAQTVRDTYPHVDRRLLADIYFDQPDIALARLRVLHDLGFAPFDGATATPDAPNAD